MAVRYALLARDKIRPLRLEQKIREHSITAEKLVNGDVCYSAERGWGLVA